MPKLFKPRLQRLKTLFTDCPVTYLTICTQDRRRILANPQIHESFQTFARKATDRQVFVGCYVIMPDHVHFFAGFTPTSPSLDKWIKSWKNALSKTLRAGWRRASAPLRLCRSLCGEARPFRKGRRPVNSRKRPPFLTAAEEASRWLRRPHCKARRACSSSLVRRSKSPTGR